MTQRNPSSILVGWDPADSHSEAVNWAGEVAAAHHHRLVIFSCYAELRERQGAQAFSSARREHQHNVARVVERTRAAGTQCIFEHTADDLRVGLLAAADVHNAALVVIGSDPSSNPGTLHLRSSTEFLAHHCDRPFAVIRKLSHDGLSHDGIVVAADGSAHSAAAVRWATDLAEVMQVSLTQAQIGAGSHGYDELVAEVDRVDAGLVVVGVTPAKQSVLKRRVGGLGMRVLHDSERSLIFVPANVAGS